METEQLLYLYRNKKIKIKDSNWLFTHRKILQGINSFTRDRNSEIGE